MVFMVPLLIMATSLVSKINTRVALVKGWVNSFLAFMGQVYIGFYCIPFYTVEILFILTFVYSNDPNIPAAALFVSAVGSLGFFIISCVYFFLTWFLLKRSTTIALQQ